MSTDLEDLITFLHHGNTQIRQVATATLLPYTSQSGLQQSQILTLFKSNQLEPLRDLKLLTRDYDPIARDALGIITNLTGLGDAEVLQCFAGDEGYIEVLLGRIVDDVRCEVADACCGVLANLVKDDDVAKRLVGLSRKVPGAVKVKRKGQGQGQGDETTTMTTATIQISTSPRVLDQLMDVFVRGANNSLNPAANYDYLSYVFADLTRFKEGREYLLTRQEYDGVVPITKLVVFTDAETGSLTRRRGVASTIKNCAFETDRHGYLLRGENETNENGDGDGEGGVGLLPYLLLPLAGPEEFDTEDSEGMLDELQLLPPDKEREVDDEIIATHLETLMLLTATRENRELLRRVKVYPVVRELHLKRGSNEAVEEGCVRLVNVLMRDEEVVGEKGKVTEVNEDEDDDRTMEEVI